MNRHRRNLLHHSDLKLETLMNQARGFECINSLRHAAKDSEPPNFKISPALRARLNRCFRKVDRDQKS